MTARVVVVNKRTAKTYRPELALAPGPQLLAQPGNGSLFDLYGSAWAVGLYRDGPQLLQVEAGAWEVRDGGAALADLAGARHVSLAFDQAARPVLAWEQAGAVYVRQWDGTGQHYVTRGPFAGRDPVLIADGPLIGAPSGSDVQLYMLSASAVVLRLQRDLYTVASLLGDVGAGAVLDQAVYVSQAVQLIGARASGAVWTLTSRPYPLRAVDTITGGAALSGVLEAVLYDLGLGEQIIGGAVLSGVLEAVAYEIGMGDNMTGSAALSGVLYTTNSSVGLGDALHGGAALSGVLDTINISVSLGDNLTGGAALSGALDTI